MSAQLAKAYFKKLNQEKPQCTVKDLLRVFSFYNCQVNARPSDKEIIQQFFVAYIEDYNLQPNAKGQAAKK